MTVREWVDGAGGGLTPGADGAFGVRTGPFTCHLRLGLPDVAGTFLRMYSDFPAVSENDPADFHVAMRPALARRPFRRLATLTVDGTPKFGVFDRASAWPYFEWGMNACVSRLGHRHLALHAASLEARGGGAVLLGPSGCGKSTLTAALMARGWRLLSDEFALLRLDTGALDALARPVCLKNDSIDRIQAMMPQAEFGPRALGERKGIVAHLRPRPADVARMDESAPPRVICLLTLRPGAESVLAPCGRAEAMAAAIRHGFNYRSLGRDGFVLLSAAVEQCACFRLTLGDPAEAATLLDDLHPPLLRSSRLAYMPS